jgi:hypothetical protein
MNTPQVLVVAGAVVISALFIGRYTGGNRHVVVGPVGPSIIGASIDLQCGNTKYTVSTGNNQGECKTGAKPGNAVCSDLNGNEAEVSCADGCVSSKGSGSCAIK